MVQMSFSSVLQNDLGRIFVEEYIKGQLASSIDVKQRFLRDSKLIQQIEDVARQAIKVYEHGGKVFLAGNGGSAADAQHIAGELVSRFYFDRPGLPAIALTTDTSVLTAIGNDYGYDLTFVRQLQALATHGDLFIGISTSGNSPNIVRSMEFCRENNIFAVGLTGSKGGNIADMCDVCIKVPSNETPRIQEVHITIGHIVCAIVEEQLFGKGF